MREINIKAAIEHLLALEYEKEFELIDGSRQHKDGLNFSGWLASNDLLNVAKTPETTPAGELGVSTPETN